MRNGPRLAFWPLPFVIAALVCAAFDWPGTEAGTVAAITVLNFGLLYGAALVVARLGFKELNPRRVVIASVFALVYHAIAFALPRPESGFIRLGFGDLMLAGGALVYTAVDESVRPLRRSGLRSAEAVERALTTDDGARFKVLGAAAHGDGWLLYGRLQGAHGDSAWHVLRLTQPFALETTPVEAIVEPGVFRDGTMYALGEDVIVRATPGKNVSEVYLPPDTMEWIFTQPSRASTFADGNWLVLIAGPDGGSIGRLDGDGRIEHTVDLVVKNANAQSIAHAGPVTYALTEHYDQPRQWVAHVVEDGARDPARSDALTEKIAAYDLGSPVYLHAAGTQLWVTGYSASAGSTVAVALPDGAPIATGPDSVTTVITDGGDLLVGTRRGVLRITATGASRVGDGWVSAHMLSASHGVVSAAVQADGGKTLTLTTFRAGAPVPFLPELRLQPE